MKGAEDSSMREMVTPLKFGERCTCRVLGNQPSSVVVRDARLAYRSVLLAQEAEQRGWCNAMLTRDRRRTVASFVVSNDSLHLCRCEALCQWHTGAASWWSGRRIPSTARA